MSELPPTSSSPFAFADSPEALLQQGLAALEQADYETAIILLSKLSQNGAVRESVRLKSRVGLVKALKGKGQVAEAIALCQPLTRHAQPKVQHWAKTTLAKLNALQATPAASLKPDLSGFRPLEPSPPPPDSATAPAPPAQPPLSPTPVSDRPGFQPLTPPAAPAAASPPIQPDSDCLPPPAAEAASSPALPDATPAPTAPAVAPTADEAHPGSETSLFHYERLNAIAAPDTDADESMGEAPATDHPAAPPELAADPAAAAPPWQFRNAGRLERLRSLPSAPRTRFQIWGIQAVTVVALFWVCRAGMRAVLFQFGEFLRSLAWLIDLPTGWRYRDQTVLVGLLLLGLLLSSPWLLDWLLSRTYGQQRLSLQKLKQTHPEGCRLLRRIGQQRGWLLPDFRELPTTAPLIFSYGWLPRYSRIVVSRGLLERLDDGELATLVGYELTHFTTWTLPFMSVIAVLLQLWHQLYWQAAQWGDRQSNRWLKAIATLGSALSYAVYWGIRKIGIPLSRVRVHGGDRQTTEWTGNPNGLVRALLKLEEGLADSLCQTGYTPPLVESTDLLTPCGYETAISLGSIFPDAAFPQILKWDVQNPYRQWLAFNSSHPLLGDRLKTLTSYALQWQLEPEMPLPVSTAQVNQRAKETFWDYWVPFLQQISPYLGPLLGVAIALGLWFIGGLFNPFGIWQLGWLYRDESLLQGSLLLGLGIGIMVRINRYFPDILPSNRLTHPALPGLLKNPMALPTDSRPVRLEGTLLGRKGIANWLCQDLILKTPTGLLKLHFFSKLGAPGNLLVHPQHPTDWVGRSIEVQGWFRRGAIAWLDIDLLLKSGKIVARANHPLWSVILSLAACAGALLTLLLRG